MNGTGVRLAQNLDAKMSIRPLYVVHTGTFFVELIRLARYVNQAEEGQGAFMFYPQPQIRRDALVAAAEGMSVLDSQGISLSLHGSATNGLPCFIDVIRRLIVRASAVLTRISVFEFGRELASMFMRRRFLTTWLQRNRYDIVVLGGDMVGYDSAAFIAASHRNNIPVLIVPSTMTNGIEQAEVYYNDPRHCGRRLLNRFVTKCFPQWAWEYKGKTILRESGARAIALELLKLAPPKPWVFNSGAADAIALESQAMKDYYLECGIDPLPLAVTGAPTDDVLAEGMATRTARLQNICTALGLVAGKPMLLVALPPDFLYMPGGRPQCDFAEYERLLEFWFSALAEMTGFNKIVCPHPSADPKILSRWESEELKISATPTAELVPLCDVYIASVSSSIRWAIACGKPVINYDVYRYRYTDFTEVPGVITFEEQGEFIAMLDKIREDPAFLRDIGLVQKKVSHRWGIQDGRSRWRIHSLMHQLIKDFSCRDSR